jgi:hypothetical protein
MKRIIIFLIAFISLSFFVFAEPYDGLEKIMGVWNPNALLKGENIKKETEGYYRELFNRNKYRSLNANGNKYAGFLNSVKYRKK